MLPSPLRLAGPASGRAAPEGVGNDPGPGKFIGHSFRRRPNCAMRPDWQTMSTATPDSTSQQIAFRRPIDPASRFAILIFKRIIQRAREFWLDDCPATGPREHGANASPTRGTMSSKRMFRSDLPGAGGFLFPETGILPARLRSLHASRDRIEINGRHPATGKTRDETRRGCQTKWRRARDSGMIRPQGFSRAIVPGIRWKGIDRAFPEKEGPAASTAKEPS